MYSDYGYKKPTRFWTNIKGFNPKKCKMNCDNLIAVEKEGKVQHLQKECLGSSAAVEVDGKIISSTQMSFKKCTKTTPR